MCPHTTDCIGFCEVLIHDKIPLFKEYFKISRWLGGKAVKSRLLIHWHVLGPFLLLFTPHSITCPPPSLRPLQTPDKSVFYFHSCALGNLLASPHHKTLAQRVSHSASQGKRNMMTSFDMWLAGISRFRVSKTNNQPCFTLREISLNGKRTRARNGYLVGPQETCFIFNIMGRCLIYRRGTNSIIGPNISLFTSNTTHNRADRGKLLEKQHAGLAKV